MTSKKHIVKLISAITLIFFTALSTFGFFVSKNYANAEYIVANVVIFSAAGKDSSVSSGSSSNLLNAGHSFILIENLTDIDISVGHMTVKNCATVGTWGNATIMRLD